MEQQPIQFNPEFVKSIEVVLRADEHPPQHLLDALESTLDQFLQGYAHGYALIQMWNSNEMTNHDIYNLLDALDLPSKLKFDILLKMGKHFKEGGSDIKSIINMLFKR